MKPRKFADKHGGYWDGEHSKYDIDSWRHEVLEDATRLGYWEWAMTKAEQEDADIIDAFPRDMDVEFCESGYYIGGQRILGLPFHVEIIEVEDKDVPTAINAALQDRLESWSRLNEGSQPRLFRHEDRVFFVHVEVHAQ